MHSSSTRPTVARWPRILSEHLVPVSEPLTVALRPGSEAPARAVIVRMARALLDGSSLEGSQVWPAWLAPYQVPAAERLNAILSRHRGALLADAVGLGKSYVALAVALVRREPFVLVVPSVLVPQWRSLLVRLGVDAPIVTHESLSRASSIVGAQHAAPLHPHHALFVVDEAHRFRNPGTNRYRAFARLAVGARVLLVTATPVHNQIGDLFHLLRLFLRDHALAALGVPSLRRAAAGDSDASLAAAAAARLIVARSRERVRTGYDGGPVSLTFPSSTTRSIRAGPASDALLSDLIAAVQQLRAGGSAAPLLRLMLLRRLASSLPAFRASLLRHDAYLDLASQAAGEGRALSAQEFQRCFPRAAESDMQLVLFPLLLERGAVNSTVRDREVLAQVRRILTAAPTHDPKAKALEDLLAGRAAKTIVFSDAQHTVRYLMRRLRHQRVAALCGSAGRFATGDVRRQEVLRAFAPHAQGGSRPTAALETDVLIATDLLSEGLNLQDADQVVHYDLPWSPARLAQRVGRIDRLGSPHAAITTVTFLPTAPLAAAIAIEERLAAKASMQLTAGADGSLDWCDRLADLARRREPTAALGACAAVAGARPGIVLTIQIGALVEAIVVEDGVARAGAAAATRLLSEVWNEPSVPLEFAGLQRAMECASPLIRARLAAVQDARWRASDRDRFARRLIPWVLSAGRRAARRGDSAQLTALDALVSRLALGMTAGEELILEGLLSRKEPLTVRDMLAWHERLPPAETDDACIAVQLVAGLMIWPLALSHHLSNS
jgi:superfamily II DNA or RNA helicase